MDLAWGNDHVISLVYHKYDQAGGRECLRRWGGQVPEGGPMSRSVPGAHARRQGPERGAAPFPKRKAQPLPNAPSACCLPGGGSLLLLDATSPWLHLPHWQNAHSSPPVCHTQHDTCKTRSYRATRLDLRPARTVYAPHPNRKRCRRALRG